MRFIAFCLRVLVLCVLSVFSIHPAYGTTITGDVTSSSFTFSGPVSLTTATINNLVLTGTATGDFGKLFQVVTSTHGGDGSSTSTSYADTGLAGTIAMSKATHKVLVVFIHHLANNFASTTNGVYASIKLLRDGNAIETIPYAFGTRTNISTMGSGSGSTGSLTQFYLDSPGDTSAHTYKTQFANTEGNGTVYIFESSSGPGRLFLFEIMQ